MLRDLNISSNGRRDSSDPRVGVLASEIPTGFPLAAFLLNDIDTSVPGRLYSLEILTQPSAGVLYLDKAGVGSFTGAPDGIYKGTQRVEKFDPGIGKVNSVTSSYSLTVGTVGSTVTGVSILPTSVTVLGSATQQFTATVSGTSSPSQAVAWTCSAGSITSTGLFTAPVTTNSAQTVTVTATSVQDESKSASAIVTVAAAPVDSDPPVLIGTLTISGIGPNGYTMTWPNASDNVAVTGYEISTDGGATYSSVGNVTTHSISNASVGTTYFVRVRAYDAAGYRSTSLSATVTTTASSDTTVPGHGGEIVVSNIQQTSAKITWPAATDNVAVTGYEVSIDGGTTFVSVGNVLTHTLTALTANTQYHVRVRAFDAAGNRSNPLATTLTTAMSQDLSAPTMTGTLSITGVTQTAATVSWQAASDNIEVSGYEISIDAGASYTAIGNVLTRVLSGLTMSTDYVVQVRAYDTSGNRSPALVASMRTQGPEVYALTADGPTILRRDSTNATVKMVIAFTDAPAPSERTIVMSGQNRNITSDS